MGKRFTPSLPRVDDRVCPICPTGGRLPKLTPIRIGISRSFAKVTTSFTFWLSRIFPGLSLKQSTPDRIDSKRKFMMKMNISN